jgi:error-prone DNA polymerase
MNGRDDIIRFVGQKRIDQVLALDRMDESANANLIVWPSVFEKYRCAILSGAIFGVRGRVQHASDVIHLIVEEVEDLTRELKSVAGRGQALILPSGRGDEAKGGGSGPDNRDPKPIIQPRDIYIPDLHIETLKVKAKNFR